MLSPQVLDLGLTLASTEKLLGRLIGAHVELVTTPGAGVRPVRVDPGQLEQILANLVVNARDAMPGGGRISVSTENVQVGAEEAERHSEAVPGFYVRLRVADTGTGMDAETLAHVFEPFFTTKQSGRGTGLGLSTVYGIVRQSRGFIGVSSVPGRGTTFDVYLPAVFDQEPSVAPEEAPRALPILARPGEVVLFAEDDAPLRRFVAAQLAASGFEVLVAADGQEAARLAEVHELPIDALVTDLMMPGLSGREVADRFRTRHPLAPVIFVSGYSDAAVVGDLRIAPPTAFLQKPQGLEQLGATLRRLLDRASRPVQAVAQGAGR
jgi:CheY-like chemotaxis protein